MNEDERQALLDHLAELVSMQADVEARRRRLIHQLYIEGECSLSEIATAADLTRQGVRYLLIASERGPESRQETIRAGEGADHA